MVRLKNGTTVLDPTRTGLVFSPSGSLTGMERFASSEQAIGAKVRRSMNNQIQYTDEPMGDLKVVADFLPSPQELKLKNENTKITISLSKESVDFFKLAAAKNHMQYQKMIRQLLDEYVAHQKNANK